jgi:hypothetical protein
VATGAVSSMMEEMITVSATIDGTAITQTAQCRWWRRPRRDHPHAAHVRQ